MVSQVEHIRILIVMIDSIPRLFLIFQPAFLSHNLLDPGNIPFRAYVLYIFKIVCYLGILHAHSARLREIKRTEREPFHNITLHNTLKTIDRNLFERKNRLLDLCSAFA